MAGSFLRGLISEDVDELSAETEYDLMTQEYFRRRQTLKERAAAAEAEAAAAEAVHALNGKKVNQATGRNLFSFCIGLRP